MLIQEKLTTLLFQEEAFWRQRAKVLWMRDGDMNSKFFHVATSTRKKSNKIHKLQRNYLSWAEMHDEICEVGKLYFEDLFSANEGCFAQVISAVGCKVNDQDNIFLTTPFEDNEFKEAATQMHPDKAPGPDGLNPTFYRRFWSLCGRDIVDACRHWLHDGTLPSSLGETNIA